MLQRLFRPRNGLFSTRALQLVVIPSSPELSRHADLCIYRRNFHSNPHFRSPIWVKMPSLSPTMTEGSIAQWNKKEGEEVSTGDVLCEVQTDKAVVALECEEDGILAKILVAEKAPNVQIGSPIAVIASPDENWEEVAAAAAASAAKSPESGSVQPQPAVSTPASIEPQPQKSTTTTSTTTTKIGPAARLLLTSYKLDSSQIPASGSHGNLLKEDVLNYLKAHPNLVPVSQEEVAPSPSKETGLPVSRLSSLQSSSFTDIPLTNMRQTIAKRLTQSKSSIPHSYVRNVATLDRVMELRRTLKSQGGLKLSVNDFVIKACGLGLRLVPSLNAISDTASNTCLAQSTVDICMAVATPAGLITPILRDVDCTPISNLSILATKLANKARDGKLQPHEFQGGSFTISNLGMFGIREFTAIINPPQVAILAVGSGFDKPVGLVGDALDKINFANTMTMTLSIDSRFVDAVSAGRFLDHVSRLISDHPELLFTDDPKVTSVLKPCAREPDVFESMMLATASKQMSPAALS